MAPARLGFGKCLGGSVSAIVMSSVFPSTVWAAAGTTTPDDGAAETQPAEPDSDGDSNLEAPTSVAPPASPLVITGYVDVGFAAAQGDGTSFPASFATNPPPGPMDYYVDPFAPAVNSRGEAASTRAPGAAPDLGGFLPRSAGIAGKPSFLINTADVDLRYTAPELPMMVFTRVQVLPRLFASDANQNVVGGESTRVVLEQAFGRVNPLPSAELAFSVGKFDSVFGIEYLDNEANFRVGVTPSLLARYTTGQSVGAKLFYRHQLIALGSAVSLNVSATNNGTFVESLQGSSASLTGVPMITARLGYELNLARASLKLGASAEHGPRNDQSLTSRAPETVLGLDGRLILPTFTLSGEFVDVREEDAGAVTTLMVPKLTGIGAFPEIAEFYAHGFWVTAAEELPLGFDAFRLTIYGRYEQRHAQFPDYAGATITVARWTAGVNAGIGESLQVKVEVLVNQELAGAPQVANDVLTSSAVWTW